VTYALPAGPQPAPKRQVLIATAVAVAAGATMFAGMLALWLRFRAAAPVREGERGLIKDWLPSRVTIPEVPTNVMLITFGVACVMAQWAVYSAKRRDRSHTVLALAVTAVMGVAAINGQVFTFTQMGISVNDHAYGAMFFAITGTFVALVIVGVIMTVASLVRYLGGRTAERDLIAAHALIWYFLAAAYAALWFVVYVQK
jgi:heme/copper-type cytochrome/quinol oxidase subunit 3